MMAGKKDIVVWHREGQREKKHWPAAKGLLAVFAGILLSINLFVYAFPEVIQHQAIAVAQSVKGFGNAAWEVQEEPEGYTASGNGAANTAGTTGGVRLGVGPQLQTPELKNGCEATSLAMVLQYLGYPVDKESAAYEIIPRDNIVEENGIFYSSWPGDAYVGDPAAGRAYYCYAGPVVQGGNAFLAGEGDTGCLRDATGSSLEELAATLEKGYPVIIWTTLNYGGELLYSEFTWQLPNGQTYIPYKNLHCVVLTGYEDGYYAICDPLEGAVVVEKEVLASGFEAMGNRAVVYEPESLFT